MGEFPHLIIIFSGKRKSGKDHITELLQIKLTSDSCAILRLSHPLKRQYAIEHNLDLERLLDASAYKEQCRSDMIRWGEEIRRKDPGYFIKAVAKGPGSEKGVWIISDARRRSDVNCFCEDYGKERILLVRVEATDGVRASRGWVFTSDHPDANSLAAYHIEHMEKEYGIDDAESECDLDSLQFDVVISNNNEPILLEEQLNDLVSLINSQRTV